jgi:hypothetical protein
MTKTSPLFAHIRAGKLSGREVLKIVRTNTGTERRWRAGEHYGRDAVIKVAASVGLGQLCDHALAIGADLGPVGGDGDYPVGDVEQDRTARADAFFRAAVNSPIRSSPAV